MSDYSAYDIHRLDQAYPDAVRDVEDYIGNPAHMRRLADVGPEVYAAELTRDLANSATNPMSLAGWAAIATVRLMDAGKTWEEDTDAAWAKVDELTAELERLRQQRDRLVDDLTDAGNEVDQLTVDLGRARAKRDAYQVEMESLRAELADLRNQNHRAGTEHTQVLRDKNALANERDALKAKLDGPCGSCHPCENWADETWRRANRKPPAVITWEDTQDELKALRAQRDWLLKHVDDDTRNRYHRIQNVQKARAAL